MDCRDFLSGVVEALTGTQPVLIVNHDEFGAIIELVVSGDVATLIGRNGSNIDAIRTIAKALGIDNKHRIKIILSEK